MSGNVKANGDVRHIDHFVVAVMEPERAEKFFTEVMGARTLKSENEPRMTRIFMKLGENHIGLFSQGSNKLPKRESVNSYPRHSFQVPEAEYDGVVQRIRQTSPFVRELKSEAGAGCCWSDGLVFQDSEGNFWEITKTPGIAKTRLHHLHFDSTDIGASVEFYKRFMNCTVRTQNSAMAEIAVPSGQSVIVNKVDELSDVTKATWRGRHFAFQRRLSCHRRQAACRRHRRARRSRRTRGQKTGATGNLFSRTERIPPANHQRRLGDIRGPR